MFITAKDLDWNFAGTKRKIFEQLFPRGGEATVENARRATGAGLSLQCAAEQLMQPRKLLRFERRAESLLAIYLENTADTRQAVEALCPHTQKMQWLEADAAHERNKLKHWSAYLDGLAKAFVTGFEEKREAA